MTRLEILIVATTGIVALAGCEKSDRSETYTLYRDSNLIPNTRQHFATFDVNGEQLGFNQLNCQATAELISKQPGLEQKFWCEKGPYRP